MKIGFIGGGNMASAIIGAIIKNEFVSCDQVIVSDIDNTRCNALHLETGVQIACGNVDLVKHSDIIFLAVKPIYVQNVLLEIKPFMSHKSVVSIVTGWTYRRLSEMLKEVSDLQLICVMPNMPALVSEGMTALIDGYTLNEERFSFIKGLFDSIGRTVILPEHMLEGFIAASGSSPAYFYIFLEALADAAVKEGLTRDLAYLVSAQAMKGAAKMVLDSGRHPAELKDSVCSPGGATIEAVIELERGGIRSAVMNAVLANAAKVRLMMRHG